MAKNLVILSDGTGQGANMPEAERTNVWKLWDATKNAAPARQVTFYDEGLGVEHKRERWRWAYDLASRTTGLITVTVHLIYRWRSAIECTGLHPVSETR